MSEDLTGSGGTRVPTIALKLISESIGGLQKLADAQDRMTAQAKEDSRTLAEALTAVVDSNNRVADRVDALVTALAAQPTRQEVTVHGPSQETADRLAEAQTNEANQRAAFWQKLTWAIGIVATGGGVAAYFLGGQ